MDFGSHGLTTTRTELDRHGILHTGTGATIDEAFTPLDLGSVVVFAVCENEFGGVTYERPGVAVFDHLRVLYSKIQAAKATKRVIVTYHGGSEIIPIPQSYLRDRFQMLREFGADLVIGHHPHVVQGYENNIFYSLGNFFCEGGKFSHYENADWGLCVSYDTETQAATLHHVGSVNGTLQFVSKDANLTALNALLESPDYQKLSDHISRELCTRWYLSSPVNQVSIMLHYFRCDAHRHNYVVGLSALHGETDGKSKEHTVDITHTDSFHIRFTK
jgi:poly-gamma-glutamate synthesis protein (capsule biosynthesis protein)